ncbi:hypothetical protein EVAR_77991_1 [Eumeta japonica]|uniref:Uncharacterized protein n=1 Tax=Eumeta variegata TaxID=151549 RepID=A0A4C1T023_EUMVA|nr:hypothetical protein EVAR_77991_1 [Eumeta japonica]
MEARRGKSSTWSYEISKEISQAGLFFEERPVLVNENVGFNPRLSAIRHSLGDFRFPDSMKWLALFGDDTALNAYMSTLKQLTVKNSASRTELHRSASCTDKASMLLCDLF